jgi:D-alanyl-D-alanine carboxypeptidase
MRSIAITASMLVVLVGCVAIEDEPEPVVVDEVVAPPLPPAEPVVEPEPEFDRSLYSIDEADSLWVVVNKARPLVPIDYTPENLVTPDVPASHQALLRADAALALENMYAEAVNQGVAFRLQSSYRSFTTQQRVKETSVSNLGQEVSDQRSARPGYSEHQTGLAVDLTTGNNTCTLNPCFAETPEGLWLAENAWRFGFVLRYGEGQTAITGYVFEPWHFRFVGPLLAEEIYRQGNPTLEEFFGLAPAPNYPDSSVKAPEPIDSEQPGRVTPPGNPGEPSFPDDPE